MKYKTLFRLMLKAIGVLLAVQGLGQAFSYTSQLIVALVQGNPYPRWPVYLVYLPSGFVQLVLGLYLFFGGKWIVNKAIPGNRPYCHECGYDLTGAPRNRCPECDTPFRAEDVRPPGTANRSDHEPGSPS